MKCFPEEKNYIELRIKQPSEGRIKVLYVEKDGRSVEEVGEIKMSKNSYKLFLSPQFIEKIRKTNLLYWYLNDNTILLSDKIINLPAYYKKIILSSYCPGD